MTAHASPSPAAWLSAMIPLWNQQAMLGAEASQVVARRLWLIALGDPRAAAESQRMVTEKIEALGQVWWDMARVQADALMRGRPALPRTFMPGARCRPIAAKCGPTCAACRAEQRPRGRRRSIPPRRFDEAPAHRAAQAKRHRQAQPRAPFRPAAAGQQPARNQAQDGEHQQGKTSDGDHG
ncbi:hypothetical protein ACFS32_19255 [Novosphingobium pokkalii]|uniref:hypothetical protein n=1 Tax=Novosphingobium pokkalii TaxID=1770194 RepID=UPI00363F8439